MTQVPLTTGAGVGGTVEQLYPQNCSSSPTIWSATQLGVLFENEPPFAIIAAVEQSESGGGAPGKLNRPGTIQVGPWQVDSTPMLFVRIDQ